MLFVISSGVLIVLAKISLLAAIISVGVEVQWSACHTLLKTSSLILSQTSTDNRFTPPEKVEHLALVQCFRLLFH